MSTEQWQDWKLGPDPLCSQRWQRVRLRQAVADFTVSIDGMVAEYVAAAEHMARAAEAAAAHVARFSALFARCAPLGERWRELAS